MLPRSKADTHRARPWYHQPEHMTSSIDQPASSVLKLEGIASEYDGIYAAGGSLPTTPSGASTEDEPDPPFQTVKWLTVLVAVTSAPRTLSKGELDLTAPLPIHPSPRRSSSGLCRGSTTRRGACGHGNKTFAWSFEAPTSAVCFRRRGSSLWRRPGTTFGRVLCMDGVGTILQLERSHKSVATQTAVPLAYTSGNSLPCKT